MNRVVPSPSVARSPLAAPLAAAPAAPATARPKTAGAAAGAIAVARGRRRRTADRALHPRHRHADGRRAGRRRRRNGRPRRRDADRARHARSTAGRRARFACRRPKPTRRSKEAEANAAQIEARLGLTPAARSTSTPCPKCRTPRRRYDLAQSEFSAHQVAARSARRLAVGVRPAADADGSGAPAVRGGEERRGAAVSVAAGGARARRRWRARRSPTPSSARRLPASSRERLVSVGDYVTKGMKVAVVVRVNPLRVQLTMPEQFVSAVAVGQPVDLRGRRLSRAASSTARSEYVSPALQADQRALTVEAVVPNPERRAQAGPVRHRAHRAAEADAGRARAGRRGADHRRHEPRVRRQRRPRRRAHRHGRPDGRRRWSKSPMGLKAGERVATKNVAQLADGIATVVSLDRRNGLGVIMQWLAALCVKRPVFATVLILSLTVVGVFSFTRLGVDRFPKIDFPTIVVTTVQPGAAPEQIETEITDKIEEAVNTISGIDELRSISSEGVSQVMISFLLEKDTDVAAQEVRDKVNGVLPLLPQDDSAAARRPVRSRRGAGAQPGAHARTSRSATSPNTRTRCCAASSKASTASARCSSSAAASARSTSGSTPIGCAPTTSRSPTSRARCRRRTSRFPAAASIRGRSR